MQDQLPSNWQIIKFGDIASFYYGKMPDKSRLKESGTYPVYSGYQIVGYYDEFNSDEDLVIVARGVGGTGDVKISPAKSFVTNLSIVAKLNSNEVDKRYLYYKYKKAGLRYLDSGSAQSQITILDLQKLEIEMPNLKTQKKIVEVLSAFDDKIELNNKIVKTLEVMTQSIFKEWFVKFKFPGHEKLEFIDSENGKIPEGWNTFSVEDLVKRMPVGKKYDSNSVISSGIIPVLDQGKSGIIGYHNAKPDVIATEVDPIIVFANHTCYQNLLMYSFSVIQNVIPFYPSDKNFRNIYWLYLATFGLVKFNDYKGHWPEFVSKRIIVPTFETSEEFGKIVKPIFIKKYKIEQENQKLSDLRDLLMPKLMRGEIKV